MNKKLFILLAAFFTNSLLFAQQNDSISSLLDLPLEKLMDIPIYSASKTEETSFDAPLSSSVITREQIRNAGSTTIMEALRLLPGVIVREQTNGNYDVHILGLDNVPPNSSLIFFANSTTLVMIDNRPVYNYLHGGTFWETLPITLDDVERIELVRGPCAAMYGPNAVSGVINIITRRPDRKGAYANAHVQYGSANTLITQASAGYKFNDKVSAWVSGNFQRRDRTQSTYYDISSDRYVPIDSVLAIRRAQATNPQIISQSYPDPNRSMNVYGYNGFVDYNPSEKVHFSFAVGGQNSEVQNEFGSGLAYINTATSATNYASLRAGIYGLNIQLSYLTGTEAPVLGQKIWKWDLHTMDAVIEYEYKKIKNLSIVPGISYRNADYNDTKYVNTAIREGLWNGNAISTTKAVSLRLDYKTTNKRLRLVGAGRLDNFNFPAKVYASYLFAATYKLNENNLIRISEGRANRTPLLIDVYSNLDLTGPLPLRNPSQTYLFRYRGNKNIRLLTSDMETIGYRSKINDNLAIDLDVFYSRTKDFSTTIFESGSFDSAAAVSFTGLLDENNVNVRVHQFGGTLTVDYVVGKFQIKPFVTVQKTTLLDYSPYTNSSVVPPLSSNNNNPALYNVNFNKGTEINDLATPSFYGGAYINWLAGKKLNININPYFFTSNTELESSNLTYKDGHRGVQQVNAKFLLNAAVSYKFTPRLAASVNFRNILNDNSVEFYKGDAPGFAVYGGVSFEY